MQNEDCNPRILIVAAEASSSLYAQRLLEHWKNTGFEVEAFGIGSRDMEALGFECLGRSEDMAVVGVTEILAHFSEIRKVFHSLVDAAKLRKPDVVLLLDYPEFNFRLAKKMSQLGLKVVYYISPQIWAWRSSRVQLVQKYIDKMLVLFPFEKDFYKTHGVDVEFVGHPLLDELGVDYNDPTEVRHLRGKYGFGPQDRVLGLMPGSRRSELAHHLKTQLETAELLYRKNPELKIALLVAPHFDLDKIKAEIPEVNFPLTLVKLNPFSMISMMDVILVASGTATLMVGILGKPMVIMYKMSAITGWLAKIFVRSTNFFGLINLIHQKKVAPEFFQSEANPANLAKNLEAYLFDNKQREQVSKELLKTSALLGTQGITLRVAEALKPYFEKEGSDGSF
ncbi:MAG TPA: lipid-A-disaccharide synthase [Bdellovibrionales bacterium]|nr:lipid-A-disaccharide synthase [Pseudobdellovibrionaceae bacterium]HAG92313.1 lipid-A-disaccharide synthase [Bdellovibrionales bacterium]|tara:strand:- start:607 stop:1794 length:1188 start_codon:yes stop_codon:yes gene_type:complete